MMKATDLRERDHVAHLGRLDRAGHRTVVVQRPVNARVMVVGDVAAENSAERLLVEDQDMVEALSTNGPDQPFAIRILPGRARRRRTQVVSAVSDQDGEQGRCHPLPRGGFPLADGSRPMSEFDGLKRPGLRFEVSSRFTGSHQVAVSQDPNGTQISPLAPSDRMRENRKLLKTQRLCWSR